MDIAQLLAFTMQNEASDLHLSPTSPPIIRHLGDLKRVKSDPLKSEDIRSMAYSVMTEEQRAQFEKEKELDFAISFGEKARFRVNVFTTRNGTTCVFRSIPSVVPTLDELDMPPILRQLSEMDKGIILVAGQTGSGKSTTMAAMLNHINETMAKHIITIEDPVEFFHTSKAGLVNHREIGSDTDSFSKALKSAMREDPDVILVGEMRDHETVGLALTAAETGHLVLGTIHANTAAKTVDRIIDVFPTGDKDMARTMLSTSLQAVVQQRLIKRADGGGRVAAHEILIGTNAVRNLIRENQISQLYSMIQTGARYGMCTLEENIHSLLNQGLIAEEEAKKVLRRAGDEVVASGSKDEKGKKKKGTDEQAAPPPPPPPPQPVTNNPADNAAGQAGAGMEFAEETKQAPQDDEDEGYSF